ncbi:auxin-induced protein X10A-like [Arachis ipaensis]|uniref:auxin-induced protein X10A-like n=1 Tax=Arachis ipaensis TaxID=130454 RepID=UPI000A2B1F2A|nr:auxin-induced protein X10A-like [Arachis ipaensis]QHO00042.1 Auxin-induced proteinA [Arachis hypogaea]
MATIYTLLLVFSNNTNQLHLLKYQYSHISLNQILQEQSISFSFEQQEETMAFRILGIRKASLSASKGTNVPKGYLAVYVGDKMRRFVIPVCYLNQPSFQGLLNQAEEEFGYDHPTGGLTIPCCEDEFLNLTSQLGVQ